MSRFHFVIQKNSQEHTEHCFRVRIVETENNTVCFTRFWVCISALTFGYWLNGKSNDGLILGMPLYTG